MGRQPRGETWGVPALPETGTTIDNEPCPSAIHHIGPSGNRRQACLQIVGPVCDGRSANVRPRATRRRAGGAVHRQYPTHASVMQGTVTAKSAWLARAKQTILTCAAMPARVRLSHFLDCHKQKYYNFCSPSQASNEQSRCTLYKTANRDSTTVRRATRITLGEEAEVVAVLLGELDQRGAQRLG